MTTEDKAIEQEQYPERFYTKSEYTFTKGELTLINTYSVIKEMGEMAKTLAINLINSICVPRVGHSSSKEIGIFYDNLAGTFAIYTPKHFCQLCKKKAAFEVFNKEYYCKGCIQLAPTMVQIQKENEAKKANSS
jgi:hypothetical protein